MGTSEKHVQNQEYHCIETFCLVTPLTNRWIYSNGEPNDIVVNENKTEEYCSHVLSLLPWWNSLLFSEYGMHAITGLD